MEREEERERNTNLINPNCRRYRGYGYISTAKDNCQWSGGESYAVIFDRRHRFVDVRLRGQYNAIARRLSHKFDMAALSRTQFGGYCGYTGQRWSEFLFGPMCLFYLFFLPFSIRERWNRLLIPFRWILAVGWAFQIYQWRYPFQNQLQDDVNLDRISNKKCLFLHFHLAKTFKCFFCDILFWNWN